MSADVTSLLTPQVAAVSEGLDVSNLVQRAVVPPVGGGQVSAARSLQDDEDGSHQHPQPAEPEHHQQRPAGPHPAEDDEQTRRKSRTQRSITALIITFLP